MGTIVFKLAGQNADALKAFLELDEAQRKVLTGSKSLETQTKQTGSVAKESARDMTNMGESMFGAFSKVLGVLGLGGGVMGVVSMLKSEIAATSRELEQLGKISDDFTAKRAQTATSMPGRAETNIQTLRGLEQWAQAERKPYLKSEINATLAAYASAAGAEATEAQKISATKAALATKERYNAPTFAAVQGTLARAYPELLKDPQRLNDMTALLMETGQAAAGQIPGALPLMVMAKEAGLKPEDTVSLLYGAGLATGDVGSVTPYLRSLNSRDKTVLKPRDIKPDTFKDPKEFALFKQLQAMGEIERGYALENDDEARRVWYGKEITKETYDKAQFDTMSADQQRAAIMNRQVRAADIYGSRAAAMPTIFAKQDIARARLSQSGVYAGATATPDAERQKDIQLEYLKQSAAEKRADAFDMAADMRALIEAFQTDHPESRIGMFGVDKLKADPLALYDKMIWRATHGMRDAPTEAQVEAAARFATPTVAFGEYRRRYSQERENPRFGGGENAHAAMNLVKSVGGAAIGAVQELYSKPKVELSTGDSNSLSALLYEAIKTNTLSTFNIMNYPMY